MASISAFDSVAPAPCALPLRVLNAEPRQGIQICARRGRNRAAKLEALSSCSEHSNERAVRSRETRRERGELARLERLSAIGLDGEIADKRGAGALRARALASAARQARERDLAA